MPTRSTRITFDGTSGFEANNQKRSLLLLSGIIVSATIAAVSNIKLVMKLAGLAVRSATSVLGGITIPSTLRLLADMWQVTQSWTLGGVIQSSTALTGSIFGILQQLLNGVITCSTAVVNTGLTIRKLLGGIIICTTGGLYYIIAWLLGGAVQCSTAVTSGLSGIGTRLLNGAVLCSTLVVGGLSTIGSRLLSGVVLCSTSVVSGGIRLYLLLSGLAISTGTVVVGGITTTASRLLGGIVLCSTVVTGALSGFVLRLLSGVITCSTSTYAMISTLVRLGGIIVAATIISGGRFLGMSVLTLSGIVICGPSPYFNPGYFEQGYFPQPGWMLGALKLGRPFQGAIACATSLANTGLKLGRLLAGAIVNNTVVSGALRLYMSLSGAIVSATTVLGNLFGLATWFFGGVVLCATPMVGALKLGRLLSGVVACVTVVSMGSLRLVKFLQGIIASVTSIFGAPGGGVSYWGITGVTEPQHLWPFSITGDYSDQGSEGGITLTEAGSGNSFGANGLILNGSGWATGPNDADIMALGSTFSIIIDLYIDSLATQMPLGLTAAYAQPNSQGVNFFTTAGGDFMVRNWLDNNNYDLTKSGGAPATTWLQVIYTQSGGNGSIYINGGAPYTAALTAPGTEPTYGFAIGAANYLGSLKFTGTIKRVGVLKGEAWSSDDVAAIYAGPAGEPLGVNITIRVLLSSIIACATSMAGALKLGKLLTGAIQCATSVLGNVFGLASWLLNGAITCATSVSGALRLGKLLNGVIVCTTSVLGAINTISTLIIQYVGGIIISATSLLANVQRFATQVLGGIVLCVTAVIGSTFLSKMLGGVVVCGTAVIGGIVRAVTLAGEIISITSILGGLRNLPPVLLGGIITCGTYVLGAFYLVGTRLLGGIIVCATYLYMGFLGPVVGGFGLGRHFIGGVHKWYIKAKERLKINW